MFPSWVTNDTAWLGWSGLPIPVFDFLDGRLLHRARPTGGMVGNPDGQCPGWPSEVHLHSTHRGDATIRIAVRRRYKGSGTLALPRPSPAGGYVERGISK